MNSRRRFLKSAALGGASLVFAPAQAPAAPEPVRLFNGKDLEGWYTYTVQTKYENPGIFTAVDGMLRVSGGNGDTAYYGGLITKQAYGNYKLSFEYRWGGPTYGKRKDKARDSGLMLHCVGPNEPGPWMSSYEFQIIEGGTGDILVVPCNGSVDDAGQPVNFQLRGETVREGKQSRWQAGAESVIFSRGRLNWYGRDPEWTDSMGFRGREDVESKFGEWTRCEVLCAKDTLACYVNGKLVNRAFDLSVTNGKLFIQTEGAEIWYRDFILTPLT